MIKIYNGDCLTEHERIKSGSVDLILTDLPYGTMEGIEAKKYEAFNSGKWDKAIPPEKIYSIANRILRKNGKMVLFSQEPYTTELISKAIANVPFNYRAIWLKDHFANTLLSQFAMVSYFEDVLIFSKMHQKHDFEGVHPLRPYFKQVMDFIGLNLKQINNTLGHRRAEHTFYIDSSQFSLCTEQTYNELIKAFSIDLMDGFKNYSELKKVDIEYRTDLLKQMNEQHPSTFNLWNGKAYKSNVLKYSKDYNGHHPTQKPIALLSDLIMTFSNENDLVVDLTMGSGSTMIACHNTKRNGVGIELDQKYFNAAQKRLKQHQSQLTLAI